VEQRRRTQEQAAAATAAHATANHTAEAQRAARLEQEARLAEATADALDPEEK
jgi:hypothetical protein